MIRVLAYILWRQGFLPSYAESLSTHKTLLAPEDLLLPLKYRAESSKSALRLLFVLPIYQHLRTTASVSPLVTLFGPHTCLCSLWRPVPKELPFLLPSQPWPWAPACLCSPVGGGMVVYSVLFLCDFIWRAARIKPKKSSLKEKPTMFSN